MKWTWRQRVFLNHTHENFLFYYIKMDFICPLLLLIPSCECWHSTAGIPNLWDLTLDVLRWSWYKNRNRVHNKCNQLDSFWNHPHPPPPMLVEKLSSMKPVPGAKKVGDRCSRQLWLGPLLHFSVLCLWALLFSPTVPIIISRVCPSPYLQLGSVNTIAHEISAWKFHMYHYGGHHLP